ncbi:MAG: SCP2 sterol-binding domain-containing protein [Thermaerobacter sp.]|nr:SCP2 sterol-binding domain-containing protein [Thermaerobacter sp.]
MDDLGRALANFQVRVDGNPMVRKMLKDWNRHIVVKPTTGPPYSLVISKARLEQIVEEELSDAEVMLTARDEVLVGIFDGSINPADAYASGDLLFHGTIQDEMRLDAVVQYVWD